MLIGTIKDSRFSGRIDLVVLKNGQLIVAGGAKPSVRDIPEKLMRVVAYIVKQNAHRTDKLVIEIDGELSRSILESRVALKRRQESQ